MRDYWPNHCHTMLVPVSSNCLTGKFFNAQDNLAENILTILIIKLVSQDTPDEVHLLALCFITQRRVLVSSDLLSRSLYHNTIFILLPLQNNFSCFPFSHDLPLTPSKTGDSPCESKCHLSLSSTVFALQISRSPTDWKKRPFLKKKKLSNNGKSQLSKVSPRPFV